MSEKRSKAISLLHQVLADPSSSADLWFLADTVVLHKDNLSLDHDVKGIDPVLNYLKSYARQFSSHQVLQVAFNQGEGHHGFSYFVNKGATLQAEASARAAEGTASQGPLAKSRNSSDVLGLAFYQFSDRDQLSDIYLTRQLTAEELEQKVKHDHSLAPQIDAQEFSGSKSAPGHEAVKDVLSVAHTYSELWNHGDVTKVRELLEDDCLEVDAVSGSRTQGQEDILKMMEGVNKGWQVYENSSKEAATQDAGNAFVWWYSQGKGKGSDQEEPTSLWGISLLVFSSKKKIAKILSIRSPLPTESQKIFKA